MRHGLTLRRVSRPHPAPHKARSTEPIPKPYWAEGAAPSAFHCFVLDTWGSVLRGGRLALAISVLMALMQSAVRLRERVALLCFGGSAVQLRVAPSRPGAWRDDWIAPIAGGGGTPVSRALREASALMARHAKQQPNDTRWLWLLTDGRSRERPVCPAHAQQVR